MKRFLAIVALLTPVFAQAQACFPDSKLVSIEYIGQDFMEGRDNVIKGDWRAIWCPTGVFNGPGMTYKLYIHVVLDKYKTLDVDTVWSLTKQVLSSDDPITSLTNVIKSHEVIPPEGTLDRFNYETLRHTACEQAVNVRKQRSPNLVFECKKPTPLPVAKWNIAPLLSGQRPSRTVVNDQLVIQSNPTYLPVGTECNPDILPVFTTSMGTWMAVNNQPTNLRWLCKKGS